MLANNYPHLFHIKGERLSFRLVASERVHNGYMLVVLNILSQST